MGLVQLVRRKMLLNLIIIAGTCATVHSARPAAEPLRPDAAGVIKQVFNADKNLATYGKWRSSKIGGGGYIMNVVMNRAKPDTIYAYSDVGGIFRSDDCGRNWYMVHGNTSPQSLDNVRGLLVDPDNPDILVAAVGSQWAPRQGIYRSTDGGKSWTRTLDCMAYGNGPRRGSGLVLQRSFQDKNLLYAAPGPDGVFVSHDGGVTWKSIGLKNVYVNDFKIDRDDSKRLFLCAEKRSMSGRKEWSGKRDRFKLKGGLYRTDNGGESWTTLADVAPVEMVQDPVNSKRWYAVFDSRCVKYSDDLGKTWRDASQGLKMSKKPGPSTDTYYLSLGAGPDFLVIGSGKGSFYIKKPLNSKWRKIPCKKIQGPWFANSAPGKWDHFGRACSSVVVDKKNPNHWFFTDWYSIYQTYDAGKHWTLTIDGIENTVIHAITQYPADPGVVLMGMADNGFFRSENGGDSFKQKLTVSNNCKDIAVAPSDPNTVYALGPEKYEWHSNWCFTSVNGGRYFSRSPMRNIPKGKEYMINSICVDHDNPRQVYITVSGKVAPGKGGVWKSVDRGGSWTWDGKGLPQGSALFQKSIWDSGRQLARSRNGAMIAVANSKIYYRPNDTTDWKQADLVCDRSPLRFQQSVAIPGQDGAFLVAQSYGGLWKSSDNGVTWSKILDKGVQSVTIDAVNPQRIAVALNKAEGLMLSEDGGKSWKKLDNHIPQRQRMKMAFAGDRLVVGTPGNGVFYLPLNESAEKSVIAKPEKKVARENILKDGSCENAPSGWYSWKRKGKITLEKDTPGLVAGSGLKVVVAGDKVSGSVSKPFRKPGMMLEVSGYVSFTGGKMVKMALQSFDKKGKQIAWSYLHNVKPDGKKAHFVRKVKIPDNAYRTNLALIFSSPGTLRLDELKAFPAEGVFRAK